MNRLDKVLAKAKDLITPGVVLGLAFIEPGPAGWLAKAHLFSKRDGTQTIETTAHTDELTAKEHIDQLTKEYPGGGDVPVIILDVMG